MKDKKPQTRERSGTNRFNNFPQREYDYDKLEKELLVAQYREFDKQEGGSTE